MDYFYTKEKQCSLEEYMHNKKMLLEESINLPVKLLLSRNYIENDIIDISKLPESLYLIRNCNSFLENNYNETLNKIPKTTKDLYEMMLLNKNLG